MEVAFFTILRLARAQCHHLFSKAKEERAAPKEVRMCGGPARGLQATKLWVKSQDSVIFNTSHPLEGSH